MSEGAGSTSTPADGGDRRRHLPGDLGRRVAARRQELGLAIDEVARRADIDTAYLERIERDPDVVLAADTLSKLARGLDATSFMLLGADLERPLGASRAAAHPRLVHLEEDECRRLASPKGIGRLVFVAATGPEALPVNYALVDGDVVFCTTSGGPLARAAGSDPVAFEVDHVDEVMSQGWSVLIAGSLEVITDHEILQAAKASGVEPWAGGERDTFCRLRATRWSGRRIKVAP